MHVPETEIILRHDGAELARVTLPPGEYVIGRGEEAEICAETALLSRRHARLTINHDHLLIEDLGSRNGTFVAEQSISEPTRLFPNQAIRLGDVVLEVRRQRPPTEHGDSLTPTQAAVRRFLPDELLAQKRYAIGSQVARGGMGAILQARQQATQRDVAMKVMLEGREEGDVLRFIEEAQVTAQLEHPNIVPIYELGVDEQDQIFYTMKFVRGITLKKVLELLAVGVPETVKKYPLSALLTIFQKACDAVAFAHAKGVIHRDLKPENLMLGDFGEVLVMDWGLAKVLGKDEGGRTNDEESGSAPGLVHSTRSAHKSSSFVTHPSSDAPQTSTTHTLSGTIMGTPGYMSPEQARGEIDTLDVRSDLYSLGAILFEILHLRAPVSGLEPMELVERVTRGEVDWKSPHAADNKRELPHLPGGHAPDSLLAVCRKALAFEPAQRYPHVEDLQRDLTAYQTGFATSAENAGAWKQFQFLIKRHRALCTAIASAVVIIAAVTAIFTVNVVHARNRAEATLHELRGTAPTFAAQARALTEEGKLDEALEKITYATQLDPRNIDFLLQRAHSLEIMLRLREAAAGYRQVLDLRPDDASAQKNLKLCDQLFGESGGKDELPQPLIIKLVDALLAEGRQIEANPLAQRVGKGTATTEATLRARLRQITAQPGWNSGRLRVLPNGTFNLGLNGLKVTDLSAVRGFPISWLDVDDPNFHDVAPLAGLPLTHLGLNGTGVNDISSLAGMPLDSLVLSRTKVTDLTPLRGMKLRELYLSQLTLPSLDALAGLRLEKLDLWGSKVTDISALRGMPLRDLGLGNNRVTDFSPLVGMPLEVLSMSSMDLVELPPLAGFPLRNLSLGGNRISDLRPLAGFKLTNLQLGGNPVGDLSPLRGMPLQFLDLGTDMRPIDLAPLAECRELEEIILPRYFLHEEVLRALPKLRRARVSPFQQFSLPMKQFWAELKPEWVAMGHARTIIQNSGVKHQAMNPVQLDPDGTLMIDLNRADALPSFAGLAVSRFACDGSAIADLGPLRGLPLRRVSFNGTPVADLSPLRGMALQSISLNGTKVKDFSLLQAMPLQEVYCSSLGLTDVSFLRGKRLRRLDLGNNPLRDLSIVTGMPLEFLVLSGTSVADLTPLHGLPLQFLSVASTQVRDLSALRGMPLTELILNNTPVQDFTPLLELPKLEKLRLSGAPNQIAVLRQHPTLKFLVQGQSGPYRPSAEFWAAFDAQRTK